MNQMVQRHPESPKDKRTTKTSVFDDSKDTKSALGQNAAPSTLENLLTTNPEIVNKITELQELSK